MTDLSICICTYKRPVLLRRLLQAVLEQTGLVVSIEVVVVDNDTEQSAATVLAEMGAVLGSRLRSVNLANPNISLARNAAVAAASGKWIVMIDDDEVPVANWLEQLLIVQQAHNADVVFAPVIPDYAETTPAWIREGGYFDRRRLSTGTRIDHRDARSGNVLIRHSMLQSLAASQQGGIGPFDPAFGTTGGEDTMLFRRLDSLGAVMVWCDEAPAYEFIPAERATARWLLQRSYRTGQLFIRTELAMLAGNKKLLSGLVLSIRACVQFFLALVFALLVLPVKPLKAFAWLRIAVSQTGKLSYFWGKSAHAYGNPGASGKS
ncbi:glycosyltransferase family A protein [Undibacterium sp. TS12]|uniref:glycosyltransferase family 2 protein n=1 Tax=Undibacterium sp. TS12 TaxID=2908202 RepID=UPI001F4CF70A|nr:glycosyltransferase family A protein [Undibacterium sp. TS12]MCH8620579.1 glycosyltransferase [Undibacterium sp. TS12]